jgi:2'-5' RNA ligase
VRLFTGVRLGDETAAALEALLDRLRPAAPLRWTPAGNLHVTTRFIGEWRDERLDELRAALSALPPRPPVVIRVGGLRYKPNRRSPRMLWCGIEAPGLSDLARAIDRTLLPLGLQPEARPYTPHLTLCRIPKPTDLGSLDAAIAEAGGDRLGEFEARSFFLNRSRTGPAGSVYTKLSEFPFQP